MAEFLKSPKERLAFFRGQLRRHRNAKHNIEILGFYQSHLAQQKQNGVPGKYARASSVKVVSHKFNLSESQVRRLRNGNIYLIPEAALRTYISELQHLLNPNKIVFQRIARFDDLVDEWVKKGKTKEYAVRRAIKSIPVEFNITRGTLRRNLQSFGISLRGYK